jgi:hypothetical protein
MTTAAVVLLALSESRYSGGSYIHLFDDCPAITFAIRRDGEIHHQLVTHEELSQLLDVRQWCGNCARRRNP